MKKHKLLSLLCCVFIAWQSTAQFTEHFDTEIPRDWTVLDNDGQGTTWRHQANEGYQGGGGVRITYEDLAHDDYLISPQFTVSGGMTDLITFYAGGTGPTFPETFDVKLSTTGTNPSDFTVVLGSETTTADVDDLGEYNEYAYNLSDYIGQDVYIAIVATTVAKFKLYVDEFSVTALPSCPKPTSISASHITAMSVDLQWNAGHRESEWQVVYGPEGFDPERDGDTQSVTTVSATTLTTLNPNDVYDIYVKAICTQGSDESELAGPLQIATPCAPARTPFEEGFEGGYTDGMPVDGCWTQEVITNTFWQANSSLTDNNRAPRTGNWNSYLSYGSESWMYYPVSVQTGVDYTLTLYARQSNTSGAEISASYGTANTETSMTEAVISVTQITDGDYQEVSGSFTATQSGTIYIGIKGKLIGGFFPFYMSIDDVSFIETPRCTKPSNLQIDTRTATSATINWTPEGSETAWSLVYGPPGFDPATEGTTVPVTTNPTVEITNLTPATPYAIFVQAQCGGSDGDSPFTGPLTLKTRPVNDHICDATALVVDGECTAGSFSNVGASLEANEPQGSCFDAAGDQTVWFTFQAPPSGNVTVTTDFEGGTLRDSELAVYEAPDSCQDFTTMGAEIGCDEDGGTTGTGFMSTVHLVDLIPGVTYYVQVNGFVSFDAGTFEGDFCIEVQDDGPTCAAPTDVTVSDITASTAAVSWTAGDREPEWELVYGITGFDPETGGTFVIDTDGILGETLSGLTPNTTYDVYIRAICNPIDTSFLSEVATFTTLEACPAPENSSVSQVTTSEAQVDWDANGTETQWEVTYGPQGFDPATEGLYVVDTDGTPGILLTGLDDNTFYDVYIRALCDGGVESDVVGPTSFTTLELSLPSVKFTSFAYYPNPMADTLHLSAQDPIEHVVIYTVLGQVVTEKTSVSSEITIDTASLAPGVYLMKVTIDGEKRNFRLLKE